MPLSKKVEIIDRLIHIEEKEDGLERKSLETKDSLAHIEHKMQDKDILERLIHVEEKMKDEDLQERLIHVEEKMKDEDLQERLIHVEEKMKDEDLQQRLIHIEDKVNRLLKNNTEKICLGYHTSYKTSKTNLRMNIVFSTTRQWNPGDEIILKGVMNLLNYLGVNYNPLIFNRNPDIHSQFESKFRASRVPNDFNLDERMRALEANIKFGMFDNSVKPDMDLSFVDWVIFAGTPEWCNGRNNDLYEQIIKYNIPVMIIGVGGGFDCYKEKFKEVIRKAAFVSVREHTTQRALNENGVGAVYLPCPALLSATPEKEKTIYRVSRIALIYQATKEESVIWNGASKELYLFELELYKRVIEKYSDKEIYMICNYVDEVPLAIRDFPNLEVRYSYDAEDYFTIYGDADVVIGPRVHGVGVSASMLIPGIAMLHDARGETCEGFKAKILNLEMSIEECMSVIEDTINNVALLNRELYIHKHRTMEEYVGLLAKSLEHNAVDYDCESDINSKRYDLNKLDINDLF